MFAIPALFLPLCHTVDSVPPPVLTCQSDSAKFGLFNAAFSVGELMGVVVRTTSSLQKLLKVSLDYIKWAWCVNKKAKLALADMA